MEKAVRISAIMLLAALILPLMFSIVYTDVAAAVNGHGVIYVDASRPDDSGNGLSWASAKKYIHSAIDLVDPDGTVYVAAGTYSESLLLHESFNLVGAGAPVTFLDGGGVSQVIRAYSSYDGNTISGFTIQNGNVGWNGPPQVGVQAGGMPVGGGVYIAMYHTVTMNDCNIRNNNASFLGGGIYNAGHLNLNRCTVSGNTAGMVGGGIANFSDESLIAQMRLVNCTIYGNRVTGGSMPLSEGGAAPALFQMPALSLAGGVFNGGDAEFWNVTIANNSVPSAPSSHGGGIANVPLQCSNQGIQPLGSPVKNRALYKNTIVANNVPDNGYNDVEADIWSLGNNLDGQNNCGFDDPSDQVNTNPLLGPLQDNGGPTPTAAICSNSPAYNRGSSITPFDGPPADIHVIPDTDQRGVTRPQADVYDIGAYEFVPLSISTLDATINDLNTVTLNGFLTAGASTLNPVRVYFQYGNNPGIYTAETPVQTLTANGPFSAVVTLPYGLNYYRVKADCISGQQISVNVIAAPIHASGGTGVSTTAGGPASVGPPGPQPVSLPGIQVVSATLSASKASPGAPVTVNAVVANKGTVNGTTSVKLYVNGQEESSRGLTVNSGSNVPVSFTVSRNEPGAYAVQVGGVSAGSFSVEESVGPDAILYVSIALVVFALIAGVFYARKRVS